jgi:hypothetical protein
MFTIAGKTGCMAELAEFHGIGLKTVWWRLKAGWPMDIAFTKPLR